MLNLISYFIIIVVIISIFKAIQQPRKERTDRVLGKGFREIRSSFEDSKKKVDATVTMETRFSINKDFSRRPDLPVTLDSNMGQEDVEIDFGDSPEPELNKSLKETEQEMSKSLSPSPAPSMEKNQLDLRPTKKKLIEAFILSECFSEPRAKKPFRPRYYKR